jgi:hypothetical protein
MEHGLPVEHGEVGLHARAACERRDGIRMDRAERPRDPCDVAGRARFLRCDAPEVGRDRPERPGLVRDEADGHREAMPADLGERGIELAIDAGARHGAHDESRTVGRRGNGVRHAGMVALRLRLRKRRFP